MAFFTCPTGELWRQIALSLPLPDCAHVGSRPYIRPLARTRDEHDRFILALLSLDRSRFFVSQIGQVEEVFEVRGERAVPKPEATRNEARVLARMAELVLAQFEGRHLLLSAAPELRAEFINHLGESAQHNLGTEFSVDIHAGPAAIAAAAEPAQRAIEEREEVETAHQLVDASPKAVAWGVANASQRVFNLRLLSRSTRGRPRCRATSSRCFFARQTAKNSPTTSRNSSAAAKDGESKEGEGFELLMSPWQLFLTPAPAPIRGDSSAASYGRTRSNTADPKV